MQSTPSIAHLKHVREDGPWKNVRRIMFQAGIPEFYIREIGALMRGSGTRNYEVFISKNYQSLPKLVREYLESCHPQSSESMVAIFNRIKEIKSGHQLPGHVEKVLLEEDLIR